MDELHIAKDIDTYRYIHIHNIIAKGTEGLEENVGEWEVGNLGHDYVPLNFNNIHSSSRRNFQVFDFVTLYVLTFRCQFIISHGVNRD